MTASTTGFTCVLDARASLAECPLWSVDEQALYWIDINAPSLNRFDPVRGDNVAMPMPNRSAATRFARAADSSSRCAAASGSATVKAGSSDA